MAIRDILLNPKYSDDMVITIGTGVDAETVKVGEIRALPAAERQALTAQLEEVRKDRNTLEQAQLVFGSKFEQAVDAGWVMRDGKVVPPQQQTQQQQQVQPTPAQIRTAAAAEFNLDENDPLLGPVVKLVKAELAARDTTIADLRTKLDAIPGTMDSFKTGMANDLAKVTGVVNTSVGRYLNDVYQSQFAAATKDLPKDVKVDYETAYKYASDHKLQDKDGFLQINDAVDRLTWDARKAAERAEWTKTETGKIRQQLEESNRVATLTPPSRNPLQQSATPKEGDFQPYKERTDSKGSKVREVKSFEEAMSEAMSDEDVLKSALSSASLGPVQ